MRFSKVSFMVGDPANDGRDMPQTDVVADRYRRAASERQRELGHVGRRGPRTLNLSALDPSKDGVHADDYLFDDRRAISGGSPDSRLPDPAISTPDGSDLLALAKTANALIDSRRRLRMDLAWTETAAECAATRLRRGRWLGLSLLSRGKMRSLARTAALLERQQEILREELEAAALDIGFEVLPECRRAFAELGRQFERLRLSGAVRDFTGDPEPSSRRFKWRGAETDPAHTVTFPTVEIDGIYTDIDPLRLRNGRGEDLLLYPLFLVRLKPGSNLEIIDIRKIRMTAFDDTGRAISRRPDGGDTTRETVHPPTASETVDRFARYNRAPPLRPAELQIAAETRLDEVYLVRDGALAVAIADAFSGYLASLPARSPAFARPEGSGEEAPEAPIIIRPQIPTLLGAGAWVLAASALLVAIGAVAVSRMDGAALRSNAETFWAAAEAQWGELAEIAPSAAPPVSMESDPVATDAEIAPSAAPPASMENDPVTTDAGIDATDIAPPGEDPVEAGADDDVAPTPAPSQTAALPAPTEPAPVDTAPAEAPPAASDGASVMPTVAPDATPASDVAEPDPAPPAPDPAAGGLTRSEVRNLQEHLRALGFAPGTPDGVMGPRTRAAIVAYQRAQGLAATGVVDRPLYFLIITEQPAAKPFTAAAEPPPPPSFPFVRKTLQRPSAR